ncbi:MAG: toxin-activating lysine-acyltransferase [Sulfuricella denitrificans]|nr:toxin-activating lysine-acyltransferase [Sulfuricella denitrificans]
MNNEEIARLGQLAREQAKAVLQKLPLLGPITWLMMQKGATRHAFVADLEWRIMPPLALDQAKLYMRDDAPLAFVSWALLSEEVVARYRQAPYRLAPGDWKSGEQVWIIDIIAPFGGSEDVLKDLRENRFPASTIRQLAPAQEGAVSILERLPENVRH